MIGFLFLFDVVTLKTFVSKTLNGVYIKTSE